MYKRDYSDFNETAFIEECQSVNLEEIAPSNSDPNRMFNSLYNKMSEMIDAHIPIKELSRRKLKIKSKPWVTQAVNNSIQIKNKLYKDSLKTKSPYYQPKFKYYRNKIDHLLKVGKENIIIFSDIYFH